MVSNAPRLERPFVEVEFLPLPPSDGVPISYELRPRELVVDARSRLPKRGGARGEDVDEPRDNSELLRMRRPGSANAKDGLGKGAFVIERGGRRGLSVRLLRRSGALGFPSAVSIGRSVGVVPADARGVVGSSGDVGCSSSCGGGILTGRGNSELRLRFRRGNLKKVVWVETVWVVVVVEP